MPKQVITSSAAPTSGATPGQATSPLAQAIRFGDLLFVSGLGSVDPVSGAVINGDVRSQTRLALRNLSALLQSAGATLANVVNVRITLRDVADTPAVTDVFQDIFAGEAVTMTCVSAIPNRPGIDIQIDCVAMYD
jgi:2-iminobutanoate/2-iminopropanoate deaminase